MKHLAFVAAMTAVVTFMSSCERKYTCTCVYPNKAAGITTTEIKAYDRNDAKDICDDMNKGAKLSGGACAL
jgi:hypothetical protein